MNGARWLGPVWRRDSENVLRRALDFEVIGRRGLGQQKLPGKRQMKECIKQIGLKKEDATTFN